MNCLVTGATGFVGSHLVEQLIAAGHCVRALVRRSSNADFLRSLGAEIVVGNLDDAASLRAACEGAGVIYHCAARVEIVGREEEFHQTNVLGTKRLVEAANDAEVCRFVFVSSCGIYHPNLLANGQVIDESTPTPVPPKWFGYGRAKYRAERVVMEQCRAEWVIVRLGFLFGPRNRTMHVFLEPTMRDDIMMLIGGGENEMAIVYVEDAARALLLAGTVAEAAGQVLIVGPTEHVTQRQYFDALADGFGIPRVKKKVPYAIAFFFGWLGEMLVKSGPRSHILCRSAIALTGLPQRLRCEKTRKLLQWEPRISFAAGMDRTFEWYHGEFGAGNAAAAAPARAIGVPHSGQTAD